MMLMVALVALVMMMKIMARMLLHWHSDDSDDESNIGVGRLGAWTVNRDDKSLAGGAVHVQYTIKLAIALYRAAGVWRDVSGKYTLQFWKSTQ